MAVERAGASGRASRRPPGDMLPLVSSPRDGGTSQRDGGLWHAALQKRDTAQDRDLRDLRNAKVRLDRHGLRAEAKRLEAPIHAARASRDRAVRHEIEADHEIEARELAEKHAKARAACAALQQRAAVRRDSTAAVIADQRKITAALAVINSIPLLKPSADLEKNELAELVEGRIYEHDDILIHEGDHESPGELIFIARGTVSVCVKGKHVAKLAAPLYVGEGRLIFGEPASASVTALGVVHAFNLSQANFKMLALSPNMQYMVPMMKREIEIRNFERVTRLAKESLWQQLKHDAHFVDHVRGHAALHHLEVHVAFFDAVEDLRRCDANKDAAAADTAAKKIVRLLEQFENILAVLHSEKVSMLRLLEQIRQRKMRRTARVTVAEADNRVLYDQLVSCSERVILETVMPSFKQSGAYRRYLEELYPLPSF